MDLGRWNEFNWEWHLLWMRERFLWETTQDQEFMQIITRKHFKKESEDKGVGKQ